MKPTSPNPTGNALSALKEEELRGIVRAEASEVVRAAIVRLAEVLTEELSEESLPFGAGKRIAGVLARVRTRYGGRP